VVLEVTSAAPLSDADAKALTKAYGKKVQLRTRVDASLIGGMVVQAGGTRMDYSLKTRLARLSRALKTQAA
jgi:F-type H+-transporting ATPase subunit delta